MSDSIISRLFSLYAVMKHFIIFFVRLLDLFTGYLGQDLVINETIYNAFTWIVIGCFGIAGVEKFAKK